MKKRIVALLMAALMLFSVAACGNNAETAEPVQNIDGAYPITITDHAGREVTIEEMVRDFKFIGENIADKVYLMLNKLDKIALCYIMQI